MEATIRIGVKKDLPPVLELIRELAAYERAEHEVENTLERMEEDGFGADPCFHFFVAEVDHQIVGLSLFYTRYSTWKGRMLYLEDIVVRASARGKRIGHLLFTATANHALQKNYAGMTWQVLDWNEPALRFYKKYNAQLDGEWINGKLMAADLKKMLQS
jgi:GNAT superfamily N-acetyltransferase